MRLLPILLLVFFTVPLIEIYLLIQVGGWLGALPTVFMVVFTAVLGALLLRQQGFATLQRVRLSLARGELPALELVEAVFLTLGGALLLTPGFFTDAIGFLCLIPPLRRALIQLLWRRYLARQGRTAAGPGPEGSGPRQGPVTLEGEFRREDD